MSTQTRRLVAVRVGLVLGELHRAGADVEQVLPRLRELPADACRDRPVVGDHVRSERHEPFGVDELGRVTGPPPDLVVERLDRRLLRAQPDPGGTTPSASIALSASSSMMPSATRCRQRPSSDTSAAGSGSVTGTPSRDPDASRGDAGIDGSELLVVGPSDAATGDGTAQQFGGDVHRRIVFIATPFGEHSPDTDREVSGWESATDCHRTTDSREPPCR